MESREITQRKTNLTQLDFSSEEETGNNHVRNWDLTNTTQYSGNICIQEYLLFTPNASNQCLPWEIKHFYCTHNIV